MSLEHYCSLVEYIEYGTDIKSWFYNVVKLNLKYWVQPIWGYRYPTVHKLKETK